MRRGTPIEAKRQKATPPLRKKEPSGVVTTLLSTSPSSSRTRSASLATAAASGLPPNVEPCDPGVKTAMTSRLATKADTGSTPPPSMNGLDEDCNRPRCNGPLQSPKIAEGNGAEARPLQSPKIAESGQGHISL